MKRFIISFIYLYRWLISPFLPASCRFTPTCSRYAISAIECHGVLKGLWMTLKRLCKCHPFNKTKQVYDPVPLANASSSAFGTANFPKQIHPVNISRSRKLKRVNHA